MAREAISGGQIGRAVPRLEGRDKVTGRAEYTHNLRLPGMLHGKLFRSTVAHGRIKSIDASAARAVPGVYRVVTAEDVLKVIPHPYYGPAFHDQPILAIGKAHYVGEPVAAVLAEDPHIAEQAAALIVAEYEELPAVFDEVEAAQNQVLVHEELKPAGTFADLKHLKGVKGTNIALGFQLRKGNVEEAFAAAAHVFEHEFRTQKVLHLPFEPFVSIADFKGDRLTLYTASQGPSFVRIEIARLLGWPENRVRVKVQKKYGMQAGNIVGTGTYNPDYEPPQPGTGLTANVTPFWMISGVGAEVEVDTETGHVRIIRLLNVCDIGTPINPDICRSQISGAAIMQIGFTMFEKMQFDGGQVTNASLADYKIPGFHDLPEIMEIWQLVESKRTTLNCKPLVIEPAGRCRPRD